MIVEISFRTKNERSLTNCILECITELQGTKQYGTGINKMSVNGVKCPEI